MDLFGESIYAYQSGTIKLMAFWCQWISGDFRLSVHSRIEWVTRQQLELYDFANADIPLVESLHSQKTELILSIAEESEDDEFTEYWVRPRAT